MSKEPSETMPCAVSWSTPSCCCTLATMDSAPKSNFRTSVRAPRLNRASNVTRAPDSMTATASCACCLPGPLRNAVSEERPATSTEYGAGAPTATSFRTAWTSSSGTPTARSLTSPLPRWHCRREAQPVRVGQARLLAHLRIGQFARRSRHAEDADDGGLRCQAQGRVVREEILRQVERGFAGAFARQLDRREGRDAHDGDAFRRLLYAHRLEGRCGEIQTHEFGRALPLTPQSRQREWKLQRHRLATKVQIAWINSKFYAPP
jgi:hypothetical protein